VNTTAIRRAIYGKLAGDTTLNNLLGTAAPGYSKAIYFEVAPEAARYPLVIFQKQSGSPTYTFGAPDTAIESDLWLVKAVAQDLPGSSGSDAAEAAQARVAALLNDASLSISGGALLLWLRREQDGIDFAETLDGEVYRHAGALYRLTSTT